MATQIPPLDNSFCNYVDDTLGGHFEMNTDDQVASFRLFTEQRSRRHRRPDAAAVFRARGSGQLIQLTGDK